MRLSHATALLAGVLLCTPTPARAGDWDLNLGRLCVLELENNKYMDCGGGYDTSKGKILNIKEDNSAFRALMSELGVVFAPNILSPADTQGFGGFSFNVEMGWTKVNPKNNTEANTDASGYKMEGHRYWRAAGSVSNQAFASGDVRNDRGAVDRIERELPPGFAPHVTVMVRKGLWFPIPSFEMGFGVRHLIGSRMWAPMASVKVALHEGFQGWPLPAFAVRGTGARVMGTSGFHLTTVGLDFSISKHFGIASTFNLTPYTGYQLLWIIADSEVLDATPSIDGMEQTRTDNPNDPEKWHACGNEDCWKGNFTFDDQSNITRHRFFIGMKANFYIASLLLEYTFIASGGSSDKVYVASGATGIKELSVPDAAGSQHSISLSVGLDY